MNSWEDEWRSGQSDRIYNELLEEYRKSGLAVQVPFRSLIPELNSPERASHLIHPYPAKLLRQIPFLMLSCNQLMANCDSVLDPFCGSGTVLVEAALAGLNPYGADTNPLARQITAAKTQLLDRRAVLYFAEVVKKLRNKKFKARAGGVDLSYWYLPRHLDELETIVEAIGRVNQEEVRSFLEVCFSLCARRLSLADPDFSVPVLLRPSKFHDGSKERSRAANRIAWLSEASGFDCFIDIVRTNVRRVDNLADMAPALRPAKLFSNAIGIQDELGKKMDIVLTSPPYGSAQKYMRASSLALTWLGYANGKTIRELEEASIGREFARRSQIVEENLETGAHSATATIRLIHESNPLRAFLYARYLREMELALDSITKAIKLGGHLILILGDNGAGGRRVPTHSHIDEIVSNLGMRKCLVLVDDIRSRALLTKRKNGVEAIASEYVYVYKRAQNGIG